MWFSLASPTSQRLGLQTRGMDSGHPLKEGVYWTDTQSRTESTGSLGNQPRKNKRRQLRPQPERCHRTSVRRRALHRPLWTQTSHASTPSSAATSVNQPSLSAHDPAPGEKQGVCKVGRFCRSPSMARGHSSQIQLLLSAYKSQLPFSHSKQWLCSARSVTDRNKIYSIFSLLYNVLWVFKESIELWFSENSGIKIKGGGLYS